MTNYWALCADPRVYRIEDAARELSTDTWTTKKSAIRAGDRVAIWKTLGSGKRRGVIALGDVLTDPTMCGAEHEEYWVRPTDAQDVEPRVTFRYMHPPHLPLWIGGPATHVLDALSVSRGQGTIFKITPEQWDALVEAAGGWPVETPDTQETRDLVDEIAGRQHARQGFQTDPLIRRAIELYAMARAEAHYRAHGWDIEDVSARCPYDLRCTKMGHIALHVEVKGTTGTGVEVLLTPNEVDHAREHYPNVALFVVAAIRVEASDGCAGGRDTIFEPWDIDSGMLTPVGYSYAVPTAPDR